MNDGSAERRERLEMLLADEAIGSLEEGEREELTQLLREFPELRRDSFQLTAAVLDLTLEAGESLRSSAGGKAEAFGIPADLLDKVRADAAAFFNTAESKLDSGLNGFHVQNITRESVAKPTIPVTRADVASDSAGFDLLRYSGWMVAVAASACLLFFNFFGPENTRVGQLGDRPTEKLEVSPAQLRADLLNQASTRQIAWTEGPTPMQTPVGGDLVWNQVKQQGFMLFDGMPVNDPTIEQYQLWIIDPSRDQHPIDGGVFDISTTGKVVVPIDAKLPVIDPKAFAITIEKPGGVVVSDQKRLPLLAAVGS